MKHGRMEGCVSTSAMLLLRFEFSLKGHAEVESIFESWKSENLLRSTRTLVVRDSPTMLASPSEVVVGRALPLPLIATTATRGFRDWQQALGVAPR